MPYVFVPSVSSGISFSSVQPPLLGLKQSVSFSEDHLSLAQGAHGWLICHELVSSSAYLRCFVHVTRSTTRESIAWTHKFNITLCMFKHVKQKFSTFFFFFFPHWRCVQPRLHHSTVGTTHMASIKWHLSDTWWLFGCAYPWWPGQFALVFLQWTWSFEPLDLHQSAGFSGLGNDKPSSQITSEYLQESQACTPHVPVRKN